MSDSLFVDSRLQLSSPTIARVPTKQLTLPIDLPIEIGPIPVFPKVRMRKTGRNLQVIALDAKGISRKTIAHKFGISERRVSAIVRGRRR